MENALEGQVLERKAYINSRKKTNLINFNLKRQNSKMLLSDFNHPIIGRELLRGKDLFYVLCICPAWLLKGCSADYIIIVAQFFNSVIKNVVRSRAKVNASVFVHSVIILHLSIHPFLLLKLWLFPIRVMGGIYQSTTSLETKGL